MNKPGNRIAELKAQLSAKNLNVTSKPERKKISSKLQDMLAGVIKPKEVSKSATKKVIITPGELQNILGKLDTHATSKLFDKISDTESLRELTKDINRLKKAGLPLEAAVKKQISKIEDTDALNTIIELARPLSVASAQHNISAVPGHLATKPAVKPQNSFVVDTNKVDRKKALQNLQALHEKQSNSNIAKSSSSNNKVVFIKEHDEIYSTLEQHKDYLGDFLSLPKIKAVLNKDGKAITTKVNMLLKNGLTLPALKTVIDEINKQTPEDKQNILIAIQDKIAKDKDDFDIL